MSQTPSRLKIGQHKDIQIVEFVEHEILDEMNINEIEQALLDLLASRDRPKLLIDFANVDRLSSRALGMLINIHNRMKQLSGQLRLTEIKPQILEGFVVTKLNKKFRIYNQRPEAMASFE